VNTDVVLSVLVAVAGLALAIAGVEMSLKPPSTRAGKLTYRAVFVMFGLSVCCLTLIQSLRSEAEKAASREEQRKSEDAARSDRHEAELKSEANINFVKGQLATISQFIANPPPNIASEKQLLSSIQQMADLEGTCKKLAAFSSSGRLLIDKLRATRAAQETRGEIDRWYEDVCSAMSAAQCEAFKSAPRELTSWVGYPANDGGVSQILRGRSQFLSSQVAKLCQ
jgi:hypothetical protein